MVYLVGCSPMVDSDDQIARISSRTPCHAAPPCGINGQPASSAAWVRHPFHAGNLFQTAVVVHKYGGTCLIVMISASIRSASGSKWWHPLSKNKAIMETAASLGVHKFWNPHRWLQQWFSQSLVQALASSSNWLSCHLPMLNHHVSLHHYLKHFCSH